MSSILRVVLATAAYGLLHSALASRECKDLAARLFGERARNAFYRPFFILQAIASFALLVLYFLRLPSRVLYHVRGPLAHAMDAGRLAALLYGVWAAWEVGIPRMLGLTGLKIWWTSRREPGADAAIPPEPEAQGPALAPDGVMKVSGPFRFTRHPLNLVPVPIFALSPKMTDRSLAFTLASAAYFWLGSLHEERRLEKAYGEAYRRYRQSGIPFYFGLQRLP